MALNWELSGIKDWKETCFATGKMKDKTYALIMCSMACGYHTIDEKNYVDVFQRLQIYETMRGHMVVYEAGPEPITLADVKAHIGLRTNASSKTKVAFGKDLMANMWAEAIQETRRQEPK